MKMEYLIDHDYHIHSYLTPCAGHPPAQNAENILKYGKGMGMKHLCITDHFWDSENVLPMESAWFKNYNYPYISRILPFPEDGECKLHLGCETDMDLSFNIGVSEKLYDKLEFIIVATSHLHGQGWTITEDNITVKDRAALYLERNHRLLDMDLPFHKVGLAHFTCSLIDYKCQGSNIDILNHITDLEYRELFSRAAKAGMGIELNTEPYEAENEATLRPYRIAKECGCKFYLGSDAHTPEAFNTAGERFRSVIDALELTEEDKFRPFG
jgi:histidinol phosphatase-like PHP family hydrolase